MTPHLLIPAPSRPAPRLAPVAAALARRLLLPTILLLLLDVRATSHLLAALALLNAPSLLAALARAIRRAIHDRRLRRELFAQLDARIQRAGLADADPRDPRRAELERAFWRESRSDALTALRQRFPREPEQLNIFLAALDTILDYQSALLMCVALPTFILFISAPVAGSLGGVFEVSWYICWNLTAVVVFFALVALIFKSVALRQRSLTEHRAFVAEQHRIASLDELAGGLSLATDQPDDLRGALSTDAAQPGQLEEAP